MKKIERYICEICGTEYNNKDKCKECESGHITPMEIVGAKWLSIKNDNSGYPKQVNVKMGDGEIITYKRY